MGRINVIDEYGRLVGWFDGDKADCFWESVRWDGHNNVSAATGSQWHHEALYRTAMGRWVLHEWSDWEGGEDSYCFVGEDEAREWLLINGDDEVVEEYLGPIEEERGPGRPEVGPVVQVRVTSELLAAIDGLAVDRGMSRAELIRELLGTALGSLCR